MVECHERLENYCTAINLYNKIKESWSKGQSGTSYNCFLDFALSSTCLLMIWHLRWFYLVNQIKVMNTAYLKQAQCCTTYKNWINITFKKNLNYTQDNAKNKRDHKIIKSIKSLIRHKIHLSNKKLLLYVNQNIYGTPMLLNTSMFKKKM